MRQLIDNVFLQTMKTYFNWSTGKDSAMALNVLLNDERYDVKHLITTINTAFDRVSMHGLRREVYERQLKAIGLPFSTIELPEQPSMEEYADKMTLKIEALKKEGFTHSAFGDIFLEDLKAYRENQLASIGLKAVFPLWKKDTTALMKTFIDQGFKAITVAVNNELLGEGFVGRELNEAFLNDLPANVDPCGENGEFHTFCFDGPIYKEPVPFSIGEKVFRSYPAPKSANANDACKADAEVGFWFCDIL